MADQLCTKAQVKARLFPAGITDTADDVLIDELIEEVTDWVQHNIHRRIVPVASATYVMDTQDGYVLRVPNGVRVVTAFSMNAMAHQPDVGGSYTALAASAILLRPTLLDRPIGWPATEIRLSGATNYVFRNVENGASVTMETGFAAIPPDMQAVAIDGTVSAYQMRKNGTSGVFGADADAGVPWWQFTKTSWKTLGVYRYAGIA